MKRTKIDSDLEQKIQDFANKHFDGNFTKAVNYLLRCAIEKLG